MLDPSTQRTTINRKICEILKMHRKIHNLIGYFLTAMITIDKHLLNSIEGTFFVFKL